MKEFFARLNPMERRFVVGVGVAFFLVANIVFVWPHFGDWSTTRAAMNEAQGRLRTFEDGIGHVPELKTAIAKYQHQGEVVPQDDQAVQFVKLIRNQATLSGVGIINQGSARETGTNQFFVEQNQTITTLSGEKQLVDFLYNLGSGQSLIRVKELSVSPDQPHQQLSARITLIASYQRKTPIAAPAAGATAPGKASPAAAPMSQKNPSPTNAKPAAPVPPGANLRPNPANPAGFNPSSQKPGFPFPAAPLRPISSIL